MKNNISKIISMAVCAGMILSSTMSVSAETVLVESKYEFHGNKCGEVIISPEIDRDICVSIVQVTEDGNFKYYDNVVIPAGGELTGEDDYSFVLEGKGEGDTKYSMTIGVPMYKGSTNYQNFVQEFVIRDTDFIVDEVVEGYVYTYTITRNDELEEPTVTESSESVKGKDNIYLSAMTIAYPASDTTPGDVNLNGMVDLYDVIDIAKYLMNKDYLTEDQIAAGDYNTDGKTDLYDAIGVAKYIMGK